MNKRIEKNKEHLVNLFSGNFSGHGIVYNPGPSIPLEGNLGDFTLSDQPVELWLPWYVKRYESLYACHENIKDDNVPYISLLTNTGVLAASFGCEFHSYSDSGIKANAVARPLVMNAQEASSLSVPSLDVPVLARILKLARLLHKELGDDVPIAVPDIQSPFGIAAIIWEKADFLTSLLLYPDEVKALTEKCRCLLTNFLREFQKQASNYSMGHFPYCWGPPDLGVWLSEDEVGVINSNQFEDFSLPSLTTLSETFGGLFMHCCADADHQHEGFKKIPNLRGLNRIYLHGDKQPIEEFAGNSVLLINTDSEENIYTILENALPDSRFLFSIHSSPETARELIARLRDRISKYEPVFV